MRCSGKPSAARPHMGLLQQRDRTAPDAPEYAPGATRTTCHSPGPARRGSPTRLAGPQRRHRARPGLVDGGLGRSGRRAAPARRRTPARPIAGRSPRLGAHAPPGGAAQQESAEQVVAPEAPCGSLPGGRGPDHQPSDRRGPRQGGPRQRRHTRRGHAVARGPARDGAGPAGSRARRGGRGRVWHRGPGGARRPRGRRGGRRRRAVRR